MSLEDLDALLNTPVGKKVPRKKKKGRKSTRSRAHPDRSEAIMRQIEQAQSDINNWRLSAHPSTTLLIVQRTTCTGCGSISEATISSPMTGFRDRLGRTHYRPTLIPYRDLPIKIQRTTTTVPICHLCAHAAPREQRPARIGTDGQVQMDERQLTLPFRKRVKADLPEITSSICSDNSLSKSLVPIAQTPQGMKWMFWALLPITASYTQETQ